MKNFQALIIFLTILLISLGGKAQWSWQYPVPQGNNINSLAFPGEGGLGYAVANHGSVLKTSNRGVNWELMDSVTPHHLNALHIFSETSGYAVGNSGAILRLSDQGQWVNEPSGSFYNLFGVAQSDEFTVYAVGYQGLILMKSGGSWSQISSGTVMTLYGIAFSDAQNGLIVGDSGLIMRTGNGGQTWEQVVTQFGSPLNAVCYASNDVAFIVGNSGTILRTANGGQSWSNISHPTVGNNLFAVHFFDENNGFVAGASGSLLETTNGGASWGIKNSRTSLSLNAIQLLHPVDGDLCDTVIMAGHNGVIIKTVACDTLQNVSGGSSESLSGIQFVSSTKGFAVGGHLFNNSPLILRTEDGENWEPVVVDTIKRFLHDLFFLNSQYGYISGNNGSLYRTNDGGQSWMPLTTGVTRHLYSIRALSPQLGFAVGAQGTLIKTVSGDTIWQSLSSGTTKNLYALFYKSSVQGGYAVGDQGTIIRIRNNGNLINSIPSGVSQALYDVCFPTDTLGFAVGYNGRIIKIKLVDNVYQVTPVPSGITTPLNEIFFPTPQTGYIAGEGGVILKSTDGGNSWLPQHSRTSNNLRGMFFHDDLKGYVVGSGPAILLTTIGGGQVITPFVPEVDAPLENLKLFPNPAANHVWIEYELLSPGHVITSIYDFSGKLIREVQSVEFTQGVHRQQIDISRLQQGIYLVMLQAGSQQIVEKLVIMK
ncbi:MAG: YCF48-related protein [Bacteroidales bacterium]